MSNQPPSLPIDGLFDPMAILAVFAIFPLLVLAVLLSVLIMTGVLTLTPSSDNQWNTVTAPLLGPAGPSSGKDSVEVQSPDGRVKVSVPAGSFNEQ